MKIVFTNGCFDIIHIGHINLLREAKKLGDILIVGLNSDSSIRKLKGNNRPIIPEKERYEILSELKCVDEVILFNEETPLELIKKLKPNIIVKGGDWDINNIVGKDFIEKYGGKAYSIPFKVDNSTTNIIERIKNKCI